MLCQAAEGIDFVLEVWVCEEELCDGEAGVAIYCGDADIARGLCHCWGVRKFTRVCVDVDKLLRGRSIGQVIRERNDGSTYDRSVRSSASHRSTDLLAFTIVSS